MIGQECQWAYAQPEPDQLTIYSCGDYSSLRVREFIRLAQTGVLAEPEPDVEALYGLS